MFLCNFEADRVTRPLTHLSLGGKGDGIPLQKEPGGDFAGTLGVRLCRKALRVSSPDTGGLPTQGDTCWEGDCR